MNSNITDHDLLESPVVIVRTLADLVTLSATGKPTTDTALATLLSTATTADLLAASKLACRIERLTLNELAKQRRKVEALELAKDTVR